jgi:transposase
MVGQMVKHVTQNHPDVATQMERMHNEDPKKWGRETKPKWEATPEDFFRGKRGDLIKLLWFDGDGLCLFQKRLERGRFIWPQATSGTVSLTRAQLSMLLEGIDWRQPQRTWEPQSAG